MKKVLVTICAMVAVLACTKTEVCFDDPSEIAFTPVSKFETKAAVDAKYTSGPGFYVFANTIDGVAYFNNVEFAAEADVKDGEYQAYKGTTPQYWPNVKTLKFSGVTKSGNIGESSVAMSSWGTMTVASYTQTVKTDNTANENDLMYFFEDNNQAGYGKATDFVNPTMKHACSLITLNVAVDTDLADTPAGATEAYWKDIKIYDITIESVKNTGKVTFTTASPYVSWESVDSEQSNVKIYSNANGAVLTSTPAEFKTHDNNIVIPQVPVEISIKYGYKRTTGGTEIVEEITNISLDYDGVDGTNTAWAAGKHYTYNLTIGADEIKIAPKSEDWSAYDANSTTDGVQNIEQDVK